MPVERSLPVVFCLLFMAALSNSAGIKSAHGDRHLLAQSKSLDDLDLSLVVERFDFNGGERFRYTLRSETPNNVVVHFEAIDDVFGAFKVIERRPKGPSAVSDDRHGWQRQYVLQPERIGTLSLPALSLAFFTTDKPIKRTPCLVANNCPRLSAHDPGPEITFAHTRREMRTDPLEIEVAALALAQNTEQATQVSTNPTPATNPAPHLSWLAFSLLLLPLPIIVLCWHRRLLGKPQTKAPTTTSTVSTAAQTTPPTTPPTLQALAVLWAEKKSGPHGTDEFYERLLAIVRDYLGQRTGAQTRAKTSEELLLSARTSPLAPQQEALQELLQHFDQVRFAAHRPSYQELEQIFERTKNFVEKTDT